MPMEMDRYKSKIKWELQIVIRGVISMRLFIREGGLMGNGLRVQLEIQVLIMKW